MLGNTVHTALNAPRRNPARTTATRFGWILDLCSIRRFVLILPPPPLSFPTPGKTVPRHPLGDGHQVTVPHHPPGDRRGESLHVARTARYF